jgi:hypothetical protein
MKTKLLLSFLLSFIFYLLSSQIPQGFNYQAIARDGSGNILPNTPLQAMLYIQSLSTGGTIFWKELHASVTTNSFGLFTLTIGTGVRQPASTVASFDLIDWSVAPKYLKTEIYYSGSWKDMGASQLYSVPYAMTARDLAGTTKLGIMGTTSNLEEALFEVKNKDGQTVFAVYNEGVRIYVSNGSKAVKGGFAVGGFGTDKAETTKYFFVGKDSVRIYLDANPLTKGKKSGFAVGGYDLTKDTPVQNYLDVSSDSVRIYIDSDPEAKKLKGGFAVGGYDMTKGVIGDYFNVSGKSDAELINGEPRVLWYPAKEAFRAGNVYIESKDSVGLNSWASGYRSKAIGQYSQALGYQAIARGNYSTSIGYQSVAKKQNSFAFGQFAQARNDETYAFGRGAIADGFRSYAFGSAGVDQAGTVTGVAYAKGDYSFALGQGSQALGKGSFAIGLADTAKGDYSYVIGDYSSASGTTAMAFGFGNIASGDGSIAFGGGTKATEFGSTAMGGGSQANGFVSTAMGYDAIANGGLSTSIGYGTIANGGISLAMGGHAQSNGTFSVAVGNYVYANGDNSIAFGDHTLTSGKYSTAFGVETNALSGYETVIGSNNTTYTPVSSTGWDPSDRLFVVGNGATNLTRSNALTILKNGKIGIGTSSPLYLLDVNGTSRFSNSVQIGNSSGPITANWWEFGVDNGGGTGIDFHSNSSATDYSARMYRLAGNNGDFQIANVGSGNLVLQTQGTSRMVITPTGNVGIGTLSPYSKLSFGNYFLPTSSPLSSEQTSHLRLYDDGGSSVYGLGVSTNALNIAANQVTGTIRLYTNSIERIRIDASGNVGIGTQSPGYKLQVGYAGDGSQARANAWNLLSDATLKKGFTRPEDPIKMISEINGYYFFWKTGSDKSRQFGFCAQEIEKILPEIVSKGNDGLLSLDYGKITPVLVEAIKKQQQQIISTQQENQQLKSEIQSLREEMDQIKEMLAKRDTK